MVLCIFGAVSHGEILALGIEKAGGGRCSDLFPYLEFSGIRIAVFPIILSAALYSCIGCFLLSSKYDSFYFPVFIRSACYGIVAAAIGGKLLFFLTRVGTPGLSLPELLGGSVFYGGMIGGGVGLFLFARKKWGSYLDLFDVYCSLIPLGQAIGRLGCYCNGCCYGRPYTGFLAVHYIVDGASRMVFPTWFIESAFCLALFLSLFAVSRRLYSGIYSAVYLLAYSAFRFFIEFFRGDGIRGVWWVLSTSQYISILIFAAGGYLLVKAVQKKERNLLIKGR